MAEAKSADPARPADSSPKLVALPEERNAPAAPGRPQPVRQEPERDGVSWTVFGLVVAVLVLAIAGLLVQTSRVSSQAEQIGVLTGQVEGLQVQLAAANTQLATFDMQMSLVRTTVAAMYEQMTNLSELVSADPLAVELPAPSAER